MDCRGCTESFVRKSTHSGSPFEAGIGFSRAVRAGNMIAVSGTAPITADGRAASPGDVRGQARRCLEITVAAIEALGGRRQDIIRIRIMLTDVSRWRAAADAHAEFFSEIRPACTFVGVAGFIDPAWLVETEADCVVSER
jgi:enamine deaminase RidA (YjgF/YER057c/UK114 family)